VHRVLDSARSVSDMRSVGVRYEVIIMIMDYTIINNSIVNGPNMLYGSY
jgi:hypothetical protein